MQRHDIWRRVEHDVQQARKHAPDGYEAVVRVFVAGRPDPIALGFVETRRPPDETWVRFEAAAPAPTEGDETIPAECYWVHVPESCILGVEIIYQRAGAEPIGFRYEARDE